MAAAVLYEPLFAVWSRYWKNNPLMLFLAKLCGHGCTRYMAQRLAFDFWYFIHIHHSLCQLLKTSFTSASQKNLLHLTNWHLQTNLFILTILPLPLQLWYSYSFNQNIDGLMVAFNSREGLINSWKTSFDGINKTPSLRKFLELTFSQRIFLKIFSPKVFELFQ